LALLFGAPFGGSVLEPRVNVAKASSSADDGSPARRLVRVSHRHLRVRACTLETDRDRRVCRPDLVDADSAASVSFWLDGAPSSADDEHRRASLTFPRHVGAQEQRVELLPGKWRVTWEEAGVVRRLPVQESSLPVVELSTISGVCERQKDACRLLADPIARRIGVTDEAKSKLSSRL
jgi:hypothetical protein